MNRAVAAWSSLRHHGVFAVAFILGLAVRVITMLGFPPAIWFGGDSASYLSTALYHAPGTSRLSGYGIMLFVLHPFHSFAVVTAVQHLLGLAVAVMIYALLRRYGLPGWGATLATVPVLFDAYQIQLEHEILPTATFGFLIMVTITLTLWWRGRPPLWATVAAGGGLPGGATPWPVGVPMLIVFLLYLAPRPGGWRGLGGPRGPGGVTAARPPHHHVSVMVTLIRKPNVAVGRISCSSWIWYASNQTGTVASVAPQPGSPYRRSRA